MADLKYHHLQRCEIQNSQQGAIQQLLYDCENLWWPLLALGNSMIVLDTFWMNLDERILVAWADQGTLT